MLVVHNRVTAFGTVWMPSTSPYARTFFGEKKDENKNKNKMKWTMTPPLLKVVKSSVHDTTAFGENLTVMVEAASVEVEVECPDEWILGYK